ncbi:MAG TPA: ABC transporter substrate-binding protein [Actinomycetota bacterium]|nr:ABC transporter substrate-binding protein [Actinomycetota bacterium]
MPGGRRLIAAITLLALPACAPASGSGPRPPKVRVGYSPNLTHAPAIAGIERGLFAKEIGERGRLDTRRFNAGPDAVQALFSKALDIAYMGPNPAINAYAQSDGKAIRIIAGAVSGGAGLVVRPGIRSADDLRGATLSSPQLGNTQDVALRTWLESKGLRVTRSGPGDASIRPMPNAQIFEAFRDRQIDGAWVPEPWLARMLVEGGGTLLVDEADLWPNGRFVTTHIVVRTAFLRNHPGLVAAFLRGHLAAIDYLRTGGEPARAIVEAAIKRSTGAVLPAEVMHAAWGTITLTPDPLPHSLRQDAADAHEVGLLDRVRLEGIYDLTILNRLLKERGQEAIAA